MSYQALYRKYRSQDFKEISGQKHITKTLMNALLQNKVAHAYLFSGPRGTGKTSIAKIFAKTINCKNYPTSEPCNECENCISITKNMNSDVIEIDAASNNGVDEIREIRDKVKYLPSSCRYKVYIIDEVHMLSTGAFNALLKTLEEPPKHVIFILATTEPHKIPATILSRCQRFDFKGISVNEISDRIKYICEQENIKIEEGAIELVAETAEGGMRDALSLLDQLSSFCSDGIKEADVYSVAGIVSRNMIFDLFNHINMFDASESLKVLNNILEDGKDASRIVNDMISVLRDLLIFKNTKSELLEKSYFKKEEFINLANNLSNQKIYFYLNVLNEVQNQIKYTTQKRAYLELGIVKMADEFENKENILNDKVILLEKELKNLKSKIENGEIEVKDNKQTSSKNKKAPVENNSNVKYVDYKDVEYILNNASKSKKELILKGWERLNQIDDFELKMIARLLYRAELVAMTENKMLLVYDDVLTCNRMMKNDSKSVVFNILNAKTHLIDDYICIPKDKWITILNDFKEKIKQGIKPVELEPIDLKVVESYETNVKIVKKNPEVLDKALEIFDKNLINVKENE
jgi:DNA polymerase-3 subunit gamma/tau